ncbi:hypothetical protein RFI_04938 [Reticulomyxa filosa]|uniref:Uncharacterized protein n=1 Tax=Reticulomyxa filosa TaxID=46433 RepID=X6P214_RETFI|nr:hypothetical protein RFI_04938 [Reticulomyxa filosa]|eukprot:ETO32178.1 hypothetical protein RFI_04938 [Reticulomyxa filosa]
MTNKPDIASLTALKTQLKDWTLKKEFSTQIEEESTKLPEDKTFKLPEDEEGKEELKKLRNWNETLDRQKELSISVYNEMITSVCEIILLTNELEIISASLELIDKCINNGWPVFDAFALEVLTCILKLNMNLHYQKQYRSKESADSVKQITRQCELLLNKLCCVCPKVKDYIQQADQNGLSMLKLS